MGRCCLPLDIERVGEIEAVGAGGVARVEDARAGGGGRAILQAEVAHGALLTDGLDHHHDPLVADRVAVELERAQGLVLTETVGEGTRPGELHAIRGDIEELEDLRSGERWRRGVVVEGGGVGGEEWWSRGVVVEEGSGGGGGEWCRRVERHRPLSQ